MALVYLAGVSWDAVPGTDRRLAARLGSRCEVVWADPPESAYRALRSRGLPRYSALTEPRAVAAPGVVRVRSLGPPGVTRQGLQRLANASSDRAVRSAVGSRSVTGIVLSNALRRFPRGVGGRRVLYVTDDWCAGAPLMGLSRSLVEDALTANLARADIVAAISPSLADELAARSGRRDIVVLPNGCDVAARPGPAGALPGAVVSESPVAGLVGQVNERLDLGLLEAVSDAGVPVVVIGPRTDRDAQFGARLDAWMARTSVRWLGPRPADELPRLMASLTLGLTPYADTPFNRASFPLKTLEYLAAGLPVVATDLPAARWLETSFVDIPAEPAAYADTVRARLHDPRPELAAARRAFSTEHSWEARADRLLDLIAAPAGGGP